MLLYKSIITILINKKINIIKSKAISFYQKEQQTHHESSDIIYEFVCYISYIHHKYAVKSIYRNPHNNTKKSSICHVYSIFCTK